MNYLLQNRSNFYSALMPRIPDPIFRDRLEQVVSFGNSINIEVSDMETQTGLTLRLDLEDAVKKPNWGAKKGNSVVSLAEVLEVALEIEQLCLTYFTHCHPQKNTQPVDYFNLTIANLRQLEDDLRYHRFRLG